MTVPLTWSDCHAILAAADHLINEARNDPRRPLTPIYLYTAADLCKVAARLRNALKKEELEQAEARKRKEEEEEEKEGSDDG